MRTYVPARLRPLLDLAAALDEVSRALGREAMNRYDARRPRARRGATLRPSAETPCWNALVACVKPRLRRRGDRALLARELGLHRARMLEFFDRQSAMPDAERALQLLIWLSRTSFQSAPARRRRSPGKVRIANKAAAGGRAG